MKPEDYLQQAGMVAAEHMNAAVKNIDAKFGENYSEKHPELVGSFMIAAAIDFLASHGAREISQAIEMQS